MLDILSISGIVAAIGVLVGVVYAVLELRDLTKTRQTEVVMSLYSTFVSKEFQEALMKTMTLEFKNFEDFRKKYASSSDYSETPEFIANEMVSVFFEGIGVLLHRKLVNIELVADLFSGPTKSTWEKMKSLVEGYKKTMYPTAYEWFEYLYNEIKKREPQVTTIQ